MEKNHKEFRTQFLEAINNAHSEILSDSINWTYPSSIADNLEKIWDPDYSPPCYSMAGPPEVYLGMSSQFKKDIQAVDRKLQGRILQAISKILTKPTTTQGNTVKPLGSSMKGFWRFRLGDYRLIYFPELEKSRVTLVSFASRGEAYN